MTTRSTPGRTCALFLAVWLALVATASAQAPTCEINAANGGGAAATSNVTVKDGELTYDAGYVESWRTHPAKRRPTDEEWQAFESAMSEIDVWDWAPRYATPEGATTLDGTSWRIELRCGERKIVTTGFEAYPSDTDVKAAAKTMSSRFLKFTMALDKLGGGMFVF